MSRSRLGWLKNDYAALAGAFVLTALVAADEVAATTPSATHVTDQVMIDGKPTDVISDYGIPIGPTWDGKFLLGADENGRDLMVRLLYGGRTSSETA